MCDKTNSRKDLLSITARSSSASIAGGVSRAAARLEDGVFEIEVQIISLGDMLVSIAVLCVCLDEREMEGREKRSERVLAHAHAGMYVLLSTSEYVCDYIQGVYICEWCICAQKGTQKTCNQKEKTERETGGK